MDFQGVNIKDIDIELEELELRASIALIGGIVGMLFCDWATQRYSRVQAHEIIDTIAVGIRPTLQNGVQNGDYPASWIEDMEAAMNKIVVPFHSAIDTAFDAKDKE